ncbi:hypothetical protein Lal_00018126 [Lupinus albus]|uniref:Uncharacterized protein n=1 Tax=Lupinus albus TaxID=3870 RepID=A0A6A4MVP8_LUPAL|nr:hypothetical protein Lalb_Chr25g0285771 [Lupinus albus]KAF1866741.1 hypothetical protein Lal_00018126 [Lupinus albus]
MARLNSALFITLLILASYFSFLDARNILKMEPLVVPSLKGTLPSLAPFPINERFLQNSTPSPCAGHH